MRSTSDCATRTRWTCCRASGASSARASAWASAWRCRGAAHRCSGPTCSAARCRPRSATGGPSSTGARRRPEVRPRPRRADLALCRGASTPSSPFPFAFAFPFCAGPVAVARREARDRERGLAAASSSRRSASRARSSRQRRVPPERRTRRDRRFVGGAHVRRPGPSSRSRSVRDLVLELPVPGFVHGLRDDRRAASPARPPIVRAAA